MMIMTTEGNTTNQTPQPPADATTNSREFSTDDEDDEIDEADAKLRSIHFLKRNEEFSNHEDYTEDDNVGPSTEIKPNRYDEMGSFLSRSQRSLEMPDTPPTAEELATRKVTVKEEATAIHNVDPMSIAESKAYYMGEEDFRRVDIDVELTTMRYEKAIKVSLGSRRGRTTVTTA
jgi:hypothetical protein